jgi:hypothetical protein
MASEMARTKASRVMRRPKVHERGVRFSSHDWTDVRRNRSPRPARSQRVRFLVLLVLQMRALRAMKTPQSTIKFGWLEGGMSALQEGGSPRSPRSQHSPIQKRVKNPLNSSVCDLALCLSRLDTLGVKLSTALS